MTYAGSGVRHYQTYTEADSFVVDKNSLSGSEWTAALKLNCGYANLAGFPGTAASSRRCRRYDSENESISHELGTCNFGENRRTEHLHGVKHALTVDEKELPRRRRSGMSRHQRFERVCRYSGVRPGRQEGVHNRSDRR